MSQKSDQAAVALSMSVDKLDAVLALRELERVASEWIERQARKMALNVSG